MSKKNKSTEANMICDMYGHFCMQLREMKNECDEIQAFAREIIEGRQQKPTVTPEHIIAKLIDTLEWKFSHFPDVKENFAGPY